MSADMERTLFLILLSGMSTLVSGLSLQYHFVSDTKTWDEAQSYCRQSYTDLATIDKAGDMTRLTNISSGFTGEAWIGLYDDLNSFMWSISDTRFYGEGETEFRNWDSVPAQEPNDNGGRELCVEMRPLGRWNDIPCNINFHFVCYDGRENASLTYVLVTELKTWSEAQRYCREFHTDLVSVRNQTENQIINSVTGGSHVWIGLYRSKVWSDGSYSSFRLWASGQPALSGASCTTVSFRHQGKWTDISCNNRIPFFCYDALTTRSTAPTTDQATTPQVTTEQTTTLDETTIPQTSALTTRSTAPTTDQATTPQVTTERTTALDETTIPQSALTTSSAPTTDQPTTPQVTTERTTTLDETTIPQSVYLVVLRMKLSSEAPLTEEYISSVVLQQLREELIRRGLPEDFTLYLRDDQDISP